MNIAAIRQRYRGVQEPLRSERRLELLLIALAGLVALQLIAFAWRYVVSQTTPSIAPVEDSLLVAELAGPGSVSAAQSLTLQARPVFWTSRRPDPEPVANDGEPVAEPETATSAESLEDFALTGVVAAGAQSQALVTHKGTRLRLAIGEAIEGWTLAQVAPDAAVLVSATAREVYTLAPVAIPEGMAEAALDQSAPVQSDVAEATVIVSGTEAMPMPPKNNAKNDDSFSLGN